MPIPSFYDYGVEGSSSTAGTPTMPSTYATGQLLVLFVATDGFTPTLSSPQGFVLAEDPLGHQALSVDAAGGTGLAVFWKRAASGSDTAPTIAAPSGGTVICYHINAYSNVRASGTPFHLIAVDTLTTASTAIAYPALTTTLNDCRILCVASSAEDDSAFNSPSGTGMAGLTIEAGWHSAVGNDASFVGGAGTKATAGAVTMSGTFGTSTRQARVSMAIANLDEAGPITRTASITTAVGAVTSATRKLVRSAAITVAVGATSAATITTGPISRTASIAVAIAAVTAATRSAVRTAAITVAVGAATAATITGASTRTAAIAVAVGAVTSATRSAVRTASITTAVGAVTAATITGASTFGPGVGTSAIDTFGHGTTTLSAPGGYLPSGGGGADVDGRTPTAVATQATGSTIYYAVARPSGMASDTITDNYSNTYTELHLGDYNVAGSWENATGYVIGATGGAAHVLTTPGVLYNEATLAWDEIKQGHFLVDHAHAFTASGATQQSPVVACNGPAWVYVDWFGDSGTSGAEGALWTVTATDEGVSVGSQWQVCDARITNHNDGWIQWKRWRRYYATDATNIRLTLSSLAPTQGADWHAAVFAEVNTISRSVAITTAVGAAVSASRRLVRAASIATAVGATTSAVRTQLRTVSITTAVGATTVATRSSSRSVSLTVAIDAAVSAARALVRSVDVLVAVGATSSAVAARFGQASITVAVGAATAASVVPAGSYVASASITVAVGATVAAARSLARTTAITVAVGAAVVIARSFVRSLSISVAVGAVVALEGTVAPTLPRQLAFTRTTRSDTGVWRRTT